MSIIICRGERTHIVTANAIHPNPSRRQRKINPKVNNNKKKKMLK